MSRPRKREFGRFPVEEITAAEVKTMFQEAAKSPPWPSIEDCQLIANVMNNHRGFFMRSKAQDEWEKKARSAAQSLLKLIGEVEGLKEFDDVSAALKKAEPFFDTRPRKGADWATMSVVLGSATTALLSDINRPSGRARDTVLVRFVALALKRMGYAGATPAAIELTFRDWDFFPENAAKADASDPTKLHQRKPVG